MPSRKVWVQEGDVFRVTFPEPVGPVPNWAGLLEGEGFRISDLARQVLGSSDVVGDVSRAGEVVILPGSLFPPKSVRTTRKDREHACRFGYHVGSTVSKNRKLSEVMARAEELALARPSAQIACALRCMLSDADLEEMGFFWLLVMHEPIGTVNGLAHEKSERPSHLRLNRICGGNWLTARPVQDDTVEEVLSGQGYAFFRPA